MNGAFTGFLVAAAVLQAASFDAASIKSSEAPNGNSSGIQTGNGLLRAHNVTLKRCIAGAWAIPETQILGIPKALEDPRYEIIARAENPRAGDDELMALLQSLLRERFKLALHRETQPVSGYALTVAKGGIKAAPSQPEEESTTNVNRGGGRIDAKACSLSRLTTKLSDILGVPVVNLTDEKRNFDLALRWTPDAVRAKPGAPEGPSLFTALQEQLGLKLDSRKVPVEMLIVDYAEPPSPN